MNLKQYTKNLETRYESIVEINKALIKTVNYLIDELEKKDKIMRDLNSHIRGSDSRGSDSL